MIPLGTFQSATVARGRMEGETACARGPGWKRVHGVVLRLLTIAASGSQIGSACVYSMPPLPNHAQAANTQGPGGVALSAEAGWGAVVSWWEAEDVGDTEWNDSLIGAARLRVGVLDDLDLGVVAGLGARSSFVVGPEVKWRFARITPGGPTAPTGGGPEGFHAALVSGVGFGASEYRYDRELCEAEGEPLGDDSACLMVDPEDGEREPRDVFLAPYVGLLISAGGRVVQVFGGLRFAFSETLDNGLADLTLFPVLGIGVQARVRRGVRLYAEFDVAGAITTYDAADTSLLFYPSVGVSLGLDELFRPQGDASLP